MVGSDRGQLILVGAIAIALILLGLVLIVNTALFTQVVGSEGTVENTKEAGLSGQEAGQAIATIVAERNTYNESLWSKDSVVGIDVLGDVRPALGNRSAESSGAYVWTRYDGYEESGSVVILDEPNDFTDSSGDETWQPVQSTNTGDLGGFQMIIDHSNSDVGESFTLYAHGSDGTGLNRSLSVTPRSSGEFDLSLDGSLICSGIPATDGTIRVDVSAGRVYEDGSCQFDIFEGTEPGYAVTFSNGDAVWGTYQFATNVDLHGNPHLQDDRFGTEPSHTEAIWSFEYSFVVDSPGITVETERRVIDVYD